MRSPFVCVFVSVICLCVPHNFFVFYVVPVVFLVYVCDYRRDSDWWLDLLTTYTHDSYVQVITEPPLISLIHK
jgi:hypothetical protein